MWVPMVRSIVVATSLVCLATLAEKPIREGKLTDDVGKVFKWFVLAELSLNIPYLFILLALPCLYDDEGRHENGKVGS